MQSDQLHPSVFVGRQSAARSSIDDGIDRTTA